MNISTTNDVKSLLWMFIPSAALSTALELQLFQLLTEKSLSAEDVSQVFGIPLDRCRCWLELLAGLDLLEWKEGTYSPSSVTHEAILEVYSPETWAFLAREARERYSTGNDLALHISHPESVWTAQGLKSPYYITQMKEDPERARSFTRMLYEIHQPLAETVAQALNMSGVERLMDLGGGSGVMSLALLEHNANLTAVVVDIPEVCAAGREIAAKSPVAGRITYHPTNFIQDELPTGFDMILECDVGVYSEQLFSKLHGVLNDGGRLVIVDWWNKGIVDCLPVRESSIHRLIQRFQSSLQVPQFTATDPNTAVKKLLGKTGYKNVSEKALDDGPVIITAQKLTSGA
ncbi:MAG: methyltransferase [Candidatus Odinarchaeota archaeon]